MKESLKLGAILLIIAAVCAGLLGFVNSITAPVIAEGKQKEITEAIKKLLPETEEVKEVAVAEGQKIEMIYLAYKSDAYIGAVGKVLSAGYGGDIEMMVAVAKDGALAGVQILTHSETPGLGANMTKDEFKNQYEGKKAPLNVVKQSPGEADIMAITGATITSRAVTEGVNQVADYIATYQNEWMKEGN